MNLTLSSEYLQQTDNQQGYPAKDIDSTCDSGSVTPPSRGGSPVLAGWDVLPPELLCNILGRLPFQDFVTCRRLNRRTAEVIQHNLLLPRFYWKQFQPEPVEERFSAEEYDGEIRSWLVDAGKSSEVLWLDSLKSHGFFPKVLFYTVSKTKMEASHWDLDEKWQLQVNDNVNISQLLAWDCFKITPNGRALVFIDFTERALRIITIKSGTSPTEDDQISLDFEYVHSLCISSNSQTVAVVSCCGNVCMVEKEQNGWIKKYRSDFSHPPLNSTDSFAVYADFSSDSRLFLTKIFPGTLRIMEKQCGVWIPKKEINTQCFIQSVQFVSGLSCIAMALGEGGISIVSVENNSLVTQYPKWHFVHGVSLSGHSLAVGSREELSAVITFKGGEWETFPILPRRTVAKVVKNVQFSPDGQHLVVVFKEQWVLYSGSMSIWVMSFDGTGWKKSGYYVEKKERAFCIHFSPDSCYFVVSAMDRIPGLPGIHVVFVNGGWKFSLTTPSSLGTTRFSPDGQAALDTFSFIGSKYVNLLRYRAGEWSALGRLVEEASSCRSEFSPDNRNMFFILEKKIRLIEIKPKNNNRSLETELA